MIERVQKVALRICLKDEYTCYEEALKKCYIKTLEERREELCISFAKSCIKTPQMKKMFPLNDKTSNITTRNPEKFKVQPAKKERLLTSALPYMQRLLNLYGI